VDGVSREESSRGDLGFTLKASVIGGATFGLPSPERDVFWPAKVP